MNILIVKLFLILSGVFQPDMHPIHVSVCNVDINDTECTVSVKLFKDDFALALKNNYQTDVDMEKADENSNSQFISKYINNCLQIELNKTRLLKLVYTSSEINEDAIWVHFSTGKIENISHIRIRNILMLDLWDDQTNLLIMNLKGKENGYRFNRREVEIEIDVN